MKKLPVFPTVFVFVLMAALIGCGEKVNGNAQANANTQAAASTQNAAPAAAMPDTWQGTVAETMDSGGYTYILLDTGTESLWCAAKQTPMAVGDKVTVPMGQMMAEFRSATLDRVFPEIYFVSAIWKAGSEPTAEAPHSHDGESGMEASTGSADGAEAPVSGTKLVVDNQHVAGVRKADGGHLVADIYARSAELSGKPVKVRGRVVKFTPNVMGTNWIHIQDGSGDGPTADLTVTTNALVAIGDLIVVEGIMSADKDFGSGYRYNAIIEKATVTKE